MTKDAIIKKFGKLIFLEGDTTVFNEYNWVNSTLKSIYDEKKVEYEYHSRLYYKNKDELLKIFLEILQSNIPVTLVSYTTNTKRNQLNGLYELAKFIIDDLKKDKNYKSPVKYFIEQYDNGHFEYIADILDAEHINIDETLEEYEYTY